MWHSVDTFSTTFSLGSVTDINSSRNKVDFQSMVFPNHVYFANMVDVVDGYVQPPHGPDLHGSSRPGPTLRGSLDPGPARPTAELRQPGLAASKTRWGSVLCRPSSLAGRVLTLVSLSLLYTLSLSDLSVGPQVDTQLLLGVLVSVLKQGRLDSLCI